MKVIIKFILLLIITINTQVQGATIRYQHTDMLGSVIAESNNLGTIISRSQYEPFGKRIGGDKAGIGYTGHLQDEDLGLTYMQARYYDPVIGRFYSNDPVGTMSYLASGNVKGFNRYAYANNNPYKYTDPDGRTPVHAVVIGFRACASNAACSRTAVATGRAAVKGVQRAYSVLSGVFSESSEDVDEVDDFNPEEDVMEDDHKTKDGRPRIKIKKKDGSVIDITEDRVKKQVPEPRNPNGGDKPHRWKNPQPNTSGKKRDPLPSEKQKLDELKKS